MEIIAKQDPDMAELLQKNMVLMEDLVLLTVKMIQELLREIKLSDLGLALRIASPELKEHFLNNVSKSMKEEILDVLNGPPQPVSKVQDAAEKILLFVASCT